MRYADVKSLAVRVSFAEHPLMVRQELKRTGQLLDIDITSIYEWVWRTIEETHTLTDTEVPTIKEKDVISLPVERFFAIARSCLTYYRSKYENFERITYNQLIIENQNDIEEVCHGINLDYDGTLLLRHLCRVMKQQNVILTLLLWTQHVMSMFDKRMNIIEKGELIVHLNSHIKELVSVTPTPIAYFEKMCKEAHFTLDVDGVELLMLYFSMEIAINNSIAAELVIESREDTLWMVDNGWLKSCQANEIVTPFATWLYNCYDELPAVLLAYLETLDVYTALLDGNDVRIPFWHREFAYLVERVSSYLSDHVSYIPVFGQGVMPISAMDSLMFYDFVAHGVYNDILFHPKQEHTVISIRNNPRLQKGKILTAM